MEPVLDHSDIWSGETVIEIRDREELFRPLTTYIPERFRTYLAMNRIPERCVTVRNEPHRKIRWGDYHSPELKILVEHLDAMIVMLINEERRDLYTILMRLPLPLDLYIGNSNMGFDCWIANSDIDSFRLFFAQGRTIEELKGHVEESLALWGSIDVLDFLLSFEAPLPPESPIPKIDPGVTPEAGDIGDPEDIEQKRRVFHDDIIYQACYHKNVDMLDRLLVRGYPVNKRTSYEDEDEMFLPIYAALYADRHGIKTVDILDRLIMYGVDVNNSTEYQYSPLVYALANDNIPCFERLLDVGARVDNEKDLYAICISLLPPLPIFMQLMNAGLDLNHCFRGRTPLEIVSREFSHAVDYERQEKAREIVDYLLFLKSQGEIRDDTV